MCGRHVGEAKPPAILHVSGDFPDPIAPEKTQAVKRWIDLTGAVFDHRVLSINRTSPGLGDIRGIAGKSTIVRRREEWEYGTAIDYLAPSNGVLHARMLKRLGDWLADDLRPYGPPDLLVGHKLTIEGLVVARAAEALGTNYAITLQGNTDGKILDRRPDLRKQFSRIYHGAAHVFAMTPWIAEKAESLFRPRAEAPQCLPPAINSAFTVQQPKVGCGSFLSAFNLKDYRIKNLAGLSRAIAEWSDDATRPVLNIAGGGSSRDWRIAQSLSRPAGTIELLGSKPPQELARLLNDSIALVLPSRRESFGMVFIEALRSGCPIIYPRGTAIHGYFDNCSFAIAVDARQPDDIAKAMRHAQENETALKDDLRQWQQSGGLERFSDARIGAGFADGIRQALSALPDQ